jgi:hypothetical protein
MFDRPGISKLTTLLFAALLFASPITTFAIPDLGETEIGVIDGSAITGTIAKIAADGLVSGKGIPENLNIQEVVRIQTSREAKTISGIRLVTIGGGELAIGRPRVTDEGVQFDSGIGWTTLPLESVRAIVWNETKSVKKSIRTPSTEYDRIIAQSANGEIVVEGTLELISATHVHINIKGESKKIFLEKVNAVVMADLGLAVPKGPSATIRMKDGSQLVGVIKTLDDGLLNLAMAGTESVSLQTSMIVAVSIVSDRLMYLSDAEPVDVQEKSLFAIRRPWQRDKSVELNPLRIRHADFENVTTFNKGLGTQAFSTLVFENSRSFDRFAATVGIDAETNGRGDCQMVVLGDGIELWSKRVRASDGPQDILLEITGIQQVSLIVYPGEQFDLGDHADWGNARFLRTSE